MFCAYRRMDVRSERIKALPGVLWTRLKHIEENSWTVLKHIEENKQLNGFKNTSKRTNSWTVLKTHRREQPNGLKNTSKRTAERS
jgi:hypothetical protein